MQADCQIILLIEQIDEGLVAHLHGVLRIRMIEREEVEPSPATQVVRQKIDTEKGRQRLNERVSVQARFGRRRLLLHKRP